MIAAAKNYNLPALRKNDLNIPPLADGNAILRMEVELRDKHQPQKKQGKAKAKQFEAMDLNVGNAVNRVDVSMEKVTSGIVYFLQGDIFFPSYRDRFWTIYLKSLSWSMLFGTVIKPEIITKLYFR